MSVQSGCVLRRLCMCWLAHTTHDLELDQLATNPGLRESMEAAKLQYGAGPQPATTGVSHASIPENHATPGRCIRPLRRGAGTSEPSAPSSPSPAGLRCDFVGTPPGCAGPFATAPLHPRVALPNARRATGTAQLSRTYPHLRRSRRSRAVWSRASGMPPIGRGATRKR